MTLQIIKSINGQAEYVLLPIRAYEALKPQINKVLKDDVDDDYEPFLPEDYVSNPAALLRIKSHVTQKDLAKALDVSQAYISKLEAQEMVSVKALNNVKQAIMMIKNKKNKE